MELARFTGRDPVLGDFTEPMTLHAYLYCLNDPVDRVDLTGENFSIPGMLTANAIQNMIAGAYDGAAAGVWVGYQTHLAGGSVVDGLINYTVGLAAGLAIGAAAGFTLDKTLDLVDNMISVGSRTGPKRTGYNMALGLNVHPNPKNLSQQDLLERFAGKVNALTYNDIFGTNMASSWEQLECNINLSFG